MSHSVLRRHHPAQWPGLSCPLLPTTRKCRSSQIRRMQGAQIAACMQGSKEKSATPDSSWNAETPLLKGVAHLPQRYKAVLLDQFGCLHDGEVPYPHAIEAVRCMAEDCGLRILLLSNSSRRSEGALDRVASLGFKRQWFEGVVTSGEVTHRQLEERPTEFWQRLGTRCLHITWDGRGSISLDGLGLTITQQPAEAEFILAHGTEALASTSCGHPAVAKSVAQLEEVLRECAAVNSSPPPMIVANPDLVTTKGAGLAVMPGILGKFYGNLGGQVHLMGKPAPIIYKYALTLLGVPASKCLAIGDSLEHDIGGASAAGIDSLCIGGGIHSSALGIQRDGSLVKPTSTLQSLSAQFGVPEPTFTMPFLTA